MSAKNLRLHFLHRVSIGRKLCLTHRSGAIRGNHKLLSRFPLQPHEELRILERVSSRRATEQPAPCERKYDITGVVAQDEMGADPGCTRGDSKVHRAANAHVTNQPKSDTFAGSTAAEQTPHPLESCGWSGLTLPGSAPVFARTRRITFVDIDRAAANNIGVGSRELPSPARSPPTWRKSCKPS